jgi:hypothetical protein
MATFTRAQIAEKHGGDTRGFLPHRDGRVVCACLRLDYNPGAPEVILPGNDADVMRWASVLCQQSGAIPVYILQQESGTWKYFGEFEVASSSQSPADIAQHSRSGNVTDIPISSVIRMRQTLRTPDHDT